MYQVNDVIVYENGGVCRIKDISIPEFLKTNEEYYTMERIGENGGTNYIKIDSDKIYMRSVISRKQAESLLLEVPLIQALYDENDKIRDREFRDIIKSCECGKYFGMLKGITKERNRRILNGKRINMNDDRNLKRVEKLLAAEFSIAFDISVEQAESKIRNAVEEDIDNNDVIISCE